MNNLIIGLTGGIGSGKTTVSEVFKAFGIPCYYADDRAKALMNTSEMVQQRLSNYFGESLYEGGTLNRSWLASVIFQNDEARSFVNSVVHPAVAEDFASWRREQTSPYVLREAAILFETGGYKSSDANILVIAPQEVRMERVLKRDNSSREEILSRMNAQWPDARKRELADFVILNDGKTSLITQVKAIHEAILSRANQTD